MPWLNPLSRSPAHPQRRFADRATAGRALAALLADYHAARDVVVLALPRGGVPVAFEVARALEAPLDLVLVRKLGTPGQEELAMGAIAEGGVLVLNDEVLSELALSRAEIARVVEAESRELTRRARVYRGEQPPPDLRGQTVILVDDGLATGTTMRAAIAAVRAQAPRWLIVAVPVAAPETLDKLRRQVDELITVEVPDHLYAIGLWYEDFTQTSDEEVCALLRQAAALRAQPPGVGS